MKKFNMQTLVNYFAFQNNIPSDVADAIDELKAELKQNAKKSTAKKTYTWNVPVKMEIDFDVMYHNATCSFYSGEPDTFWEAINDEFSCQDDSVYYNITDEIREQVANDFRNYLIEHNLSLEEETYDDEDEDDDEE